MRWRLVGSRKEVRSQESGVRSQEEETFYKSRAVPARKARRGFVLAVAA
jgi:hypothetical protein